MLDRLLCSGLERLTADGVRRLLGLAEQAAIDGYLDALLRGAALAGIAILDAGEAAGRDPGAFLDQLIARLHEVIVAGLARRPLGGGSPSPSLESAPPATVASLARRIAALDAGRGGGGARFGLEVLLLERAAEAHAGPLEVSARPIAAPQEDVSVSHGPVVRPPPTRPSNASRQAGPAAAPRLAEPTRAAAGASPSAEPAPAPSAARGGTDEPLERLRRGWP